MTEEVVVDASVMSGWLTVDDKMQVTISEDAVRKWLKSSATNMTQWEQQGLLLRLAKRGNGKWRNI